MQGRRHYKGVWGTEVPQWVQGEARWGVWGAKLKLFCNFVLKWVRKMWCKMLKSCVTSLIDYTVINCIRSPDCIRTA